MHWQRTDPVMVERINELIGDARLRPFTGIGKPEPLKKNLRGWWSRRINLDHRLVYRVSGAGENQAIEIAACASITAIDRRNAFA